jgi:hypothetical protein
MRWPWFRNHSTADSLIISALKNGGRATSKEVASKFGEWCAATAFARIISKGAIALAAPGAGAALGAVVESLIKGVEKSDQFHQLQHYKEYNTGTRRLQDAIALGLPTEDVAANERHLQIRGAIDLLELALTVFRDKIEDEKIILFLLGNANFLLPGGYEYAELHFTRLCKMFDAEIAAEQSALAEIRSPSPPETREVYERIYERRILNHDRGWISTPNQMQERADRHYKRESAQADRARALHQEKLARLTTLRDVAVQAAQSARQRIQRDGEVGNLK